MKQLEKNIKANEKGVFLNKNNKRTKTRRIFHETNEDEWFDLDNAGKIYPAVGGTNWMFVYRLSAIMKDEVKPEILQKAVDDILPRFPTFNVSIKKGFFWHYFEHLKNHVKVEEEHTFPCQPFEFGAGKPLIRFLYFNHRLSFECFHSLSDGRGSLLLFNTLIKRYIELCGTPVSSCMGCLNYKDYPQEEELEDSFMHYSDDSKPNVHKEPKAFKIKGTMEECGIVNNTQAMMSVNNIKSVAKSFGVGIGLFLCASLAYSIYKRNRLAKKPVKISVPIDLRSFFESKTLRNFSSYINIEVSTKNTDYSFEDVIKIFQENFDKITKDYVLGNINSNTALQKNVFIKILPRFVKDAVMRVCFKKIGEDYQTLAFSNLGKVEVPEEFEKYVDLYEVNLGRNRYNNKGVGVISFEDKLVLTISSKIKENIVERDYIRFLAKQGIEICVESNRRDMYAR